MLISFNIRTRSFLSEGKVPSRNFVFLVYLLSFLHFKWYLAKNFRIGANWQYGHTYLKIFRIDQCVTELLPNMSQFCVKVGHKILCNRYDIEIYQKYIINYLPTPYHKFSSDLVDLYDNFSQFCHISFNSLIFTWFWRWIWYLVELTSL